MMWLLGQGELTLWDFPIALVLGAVVCWAAGVALDELRTPRPSTLDTEEAALAARRAAADEATP